MRQKKAFTSSDLIVRFVAPAFWRFFITFSSLFGELSYNTSKSAAANPAAVLTNQNNTVSYPPAAAMKTRLIASNTHLFPDWRKIPVTANPAAVRRRNPYDV